jgi:D-lactate dehydrogenase
LGIINYFGNKKIVGIANSENLICVFKKELENVCRQGYALDNEEWAIGVCCVAAAVFDFTNHPSHAISISGPSRNFTDEKVAQIAAMKEGAVIINTARGELIDIQALIRALASGKIAAAGLDVLPEEQVFLEGVKNPATLFAGGKNLETLLANHILLQHPNVCITPHCAFFTREAVQRILDVTMANIEAFVRGEPQNVVVPL